jgi:cytochrome c oxidase subunit 3
MSHAINRAKGEFAHHFKNAEHEFNTSKFGMWVFLVTEIMMFGGLFVAYIMFRSWYPEMFHECSKYLNKVMGGTNTIVLICSSWTMALAIGYLQRNQPKKAQSMLLITLICAAIFMVIKYFEYSHKIHVGLLPGAHFNFSEIKHPKADLFFSLYFMMTGLHGFHVLIGMGLITWCLIRNSRGEFNDKYYTPVELTGLFWHLVDLIWIFLFPLMYLIG